MTRTSITNILLNCKNISALGLATLAFYLTWKVSLPPASAPLPVSPVTSVSHSAGTEKPSRRQHLPPAPHFDILWSERPSVAPWRYSAQCRRFITRFAKRHSVPRRALASFPGSGNTWTRYLLEAAAGLFTGSVYMDAGLRHAGFLGEFEKESCGCTLVQKTHGYTLGNTTPGWESRKRMVARHDSRAILLIRNPYHAILSLNNFRSGGHRSHSPDYMFVGKRWDKFVREKVKLWRDFNLDWLNLSSSLHVVHYEDVRVDPVGAMREVLRFLGLPESEDRLRCLRKYPDGKFKRQRSSRQIFQRKDVFSACQHAALDRAIDEVQRVLVRANQQPMPLRLFDYYRHAPLNRSCEP